MKQLFVFWQFNGDNRCICNLKCPECYGREGKTYLHYWNGKIDEWEKALERLDSQHGSGGLYIVFSYGEALVSNGFYECVEMIAKHPTWTLCVITNFMADPHLLLRTQLAQEKRLFLITCWHPEGVNDPITGWRVFREHILAAKHAKVPIHVMMVWFQPVIKDFRKYFEWLDKHNFRVGVRRLANQTAWSKIPFIRRFFDDKLVLEKYSRAERDYIYACTCPKVTKYGLNLVSPKGKLCYAGQDMLLIEHDGTAKLCASACGSKHKLGNVFDPAFKLNTSPIRCPVNNCGGDFGMLFLADNRFGSLPEKMWLDTFISQVEEIKQESPIPYPRRNEMIQCLKAL